MRLRADLQQIIDEIDAAERAADAVAAGLTEAQFHWQPPATGTAARGDAGTGPRGWSIGQCLDHLATMNVLYGGAVRRGVEDARRRGLTGGGPIAPSFFGAKFIASQEPPVVRRLRAPRKSAPQSAGSRDDILRAYRESHERIREIARACADIDVNRATFPNPFLPLIRMRVGTGLRILTAHDRRHLWQAEQVTKAAGFPR